MSAPLDGGITLPAVEDEDVDEDEDEEYENHGEGEELGEDEYEDDDEAAYAAERRAAAAAAEPPAKRHKLSAKADAGAAPRVAEGADEADGGLFDEEDEL